MKQAYQQFIEEKSKFADQVGFVVTDAELNNNLKPFQRALTKWALRLGRAALFEGTGLGKTAQQLSWARIIADRTKGNILILTPLAVAQQTIKEAEKFGIDGVAYAGDQGKIKSQIVVTNYERFEKFHIEDFVGIVLDESGIIKSQDGKTRALLTDACKDIPYRLCCTATPAPNDYAELGQHSEFLGVMTAKEMLSMFFVHDGSIRANDDSVGSNGWRLKRHAVKAFWRWLASWAVVVRHPNDLGFDDPEYDLPPLNLQEKVVTAEHKTTSGSLFPIMASTLRERISARRETATERVAAAAAIIEQEPNEPWLVWCNLNSEADAIEALLSKSLQVAGRHDTETKVQRLIGFTQQHPLILISKPSIAGHGMNWQHCARMVFVGLTDSFEQVYQAIRRCWRFGQHRSVDCYFVVSELEGNVIANIKRKELAFNIMLDAMAGHMRDLMQEQVLGTPGRSQYHPTKKMETPVWLAS